jgi:hypothetical protein
LGGGTAALDGTATRCATSGACITRRIAEFFEALESDDEDALRAESRAAGMELLRFSRQYPLRPTPAANRVMVASERSATGRGST